MSLSKNQIIAGVGALALLASGAFYYSAMNAKHIVKEAQQSSVEAAKKETKEKKKIFNAKHYELENGLQLVVVENHRVPVITHMVWYRVGAADEPRGKSGIAHFLEHLMFKGHTSEELGSFEAGEFSKVIRSLGGRDNAFTSQDYTAYFQSIASEHLETVMKMEAGRMRGLNPPEEDVVSENKVIQEERRQRTDNDPRSKMAEQLRETLFPNHPYSIPVIGWMHEIEQLTWDDAKSFYDIYYAPNNAIVVVSGDVDADDVYEIAQRTYGLAEPENIGERNRTESPPFIASTTVTLTDETIKEPTFQRAYRVPSSRVNKEESLALQILEEVMGGGSSSRLYKSLVVDEKIVTDVSLNYSASAWDDATLYISAVSTSEEDLDKAQESIDNQLRLIIKDGITTGELSDAVKRLQADAIYALDSVSGPAMILGYNLITGSTLDDIEYWAHDIETVTADQVQSVAKKYLNPDAAYKHPPVDGILLPKQIEEAQNEAAQSEGE